VLSAIRRGTVATDRPGRDSWRGGRSGQGRFSPLETPRSSGSGCEPLPGGCSKRQVAPEDPEGATGPGLSRTLRSAMARSTPGPTARPISDPPAADDQSVRKASLRWALRARAREMVVSLVAIPSKAAAALHCARTSGGTIQRKDASALSLVADARAAVHAQPDPGKPQSAAARCRPLLAPRRSRPSAAAACPPARQQFGCRTANAPGPLSPSTPLMSSTTSGFYRKPKGRRG